MLNGRHQRSAADELERARSALWAIDPGCPRTDWLRAAMGAKAAGIAESDFIEWSRGAANFKSDADCRAVFRSIKAEGGIGPGTLFAMATGNRGAPISRARHQSPQEAPKRLDGTLSLPFDFAAVWRDSEAATVGHPYISRKLGLADGLRVYHGPLKIGGQPLDGALLVPVYDATGALQSWQAIPSEGEKRNPRGSRIEGGSFIVGGVPRDGEALYVVEGIGAAWSAHQATGKPAVVAFGAGNTGRIAEQYRGRYPSARLIVVADRGEEHNAEQIAQAVGGAWVGLPADWPHNADVNDVHKRDGLEAVAALLESAKQAEKPEPRYRLLTADEIATLPPLRWRVRGVLQAEGIAAIYGPPGSGKSFLALDLLGAVADGREWFAHRVESCPVTYCALEGEAGIAQRVQAYRSRHGRAPARMRFVAQPFALLEPADVAELADAIRAAGGAGGIVAIDTLNRAAPGADENDSRDMGSIIDGAKQLQAVLGGLVLLVHHSGKDATKGLRGHSSLQGALDAVIEVTRDGERREWRASKEKDAADSGAHPFRLDVVELGADEHGEALTSCVVESLQADAGSVRKAKAPGGGNMRVAWDCIGELLRAAGDYRPEGAPDSAPVGRPCIQLEAAIGAVAGRLVCDQKRRRERATEAICALQVRDLLRHEDGWLWCA